MAKNSQVIPVQGTFKKFTRRYLYRRNLSAEGRRSTEKLQMLTATERSDNTRRKDSAGTQSTQIGSSSFWKVPHAGMTGSGSEMTEETAASLPPSNSTAPATNAIADFYRNNPRMVSSPFGGIDGVNTWLLAEVFQRLDIDLKDRAVLDIGCGRGHIREFVREHGGQYTGADIVANGQGFPLTLSDAVALPFPDATFDAVFCIDAFEHIPNPVAAAREMRRVLCPGGFAFLSAPNYGNIAGLAKWAYETLGTYEKHAWAPFGRWQAQEWETPLTFRRVRQIFQSAGFTRANVVGHADEVHLGLFPWTDHPRMPEAIQFRLQRLFNQIGPAIADRFPTASLHGFWKWS
jgi:ubiquinone/menaquinone biosynthesis C-methylase UbiE